MEGGPSYGSVPDGHDHRLDFHVRDMMQSQVTMPGQSFAEEAGSLHGHGKPKRLRLNWISIVECILLPWAVFVAVFFLMSFQVRYNHVEAATFLVVVALLISVGFFAKWNAQRSVHRENGVSTWMLFMGAACLLAWLAGMALADINYTGTILPYYQIVSMGLAKEVDPRDIPGNHYLDSSRLIFKQGSQIYDDYVMGFKDTKTYCVAPIVLGNASMVSYDYWAVGINCCVMSPATAFLCADTQSREVHGALRWMSSSEVNYFRLAIQQAEAEYGIKAQHPIFFQWMEDPVGQTNSQFNQGYYFFKCWIWAYLAFQIVVVLLAAYLYSRRLKWGFSLGVLS